MSNSKLNILDKEQNIPILGSLNEPRKVFVGMSGGVDSSVAAALLKEAGYNVTGVFIKVWQPDSTDCGWKDERRDAMRVAAMLDIPFLTLDFSEVYKKEVVDYMVDEYAAGRTPNPDVMCNRYVKFGSFLEYAREHGAEYVATGHYAQNLRVQVGQKNGKSLQYLAEGNDQNKDQSYFLWTLTESDLEQILFPIGHLEKSEVRKLAQKFNLPVFDKKDSQGVCFIGHLDMKEFLKEHIPGAAKKGDVLDINGEIVGSHDGAVLYTIGERHGFTHMVKETEPEPLFVLKKDVKTNTITVASKSILQSKDLKNLPKMTHLRNVNLHSSMLERFSNDSSAAVELECRIRYRQEKQKCKLRLKNGTYIVEFAEPQIGLAEGQSLVLYTPAQNKSSSQHSVLCVGGGIIEFA